MTDLTTNFQDNNEVKAPEMMDAKTYQSTLEALLSEGQGWGKDVNVGAFLLEDITVATETKTGKDETEVTIAVEKVYVVLDLDQYKSEQIRNLVVEDLAKNWGKKVVGERELDTPDFKGPGIWTQIQKKFDGDYIKADSNDRTSSIHAPDPEAVRVCNSTAEAVKIPVTWDGGFTVEAGGTLAIRECDVADLAGALISIKHGESTPEEALYSAEGVAKFDVYGMEPGFLDNNYAVVPTKEATQKTKAIFSRATTAPAAKAKKFGK